jgi:poly(A) polymerase
LLPQDVVARLEDAGIKAVPTGIAHGTITAVADGKRFEVTTLRRDVETDGRHAKIAFTDDWAADAARRDFTINALYADPVSGEVFDPVGGSADLQARRVRFIGDAGQRIDEDHLRILRWFRFLTRFGDGNVDAQTLALVAARAPQLRGLSRERIADELLRLLALPDPVGSIRLMQAHGILAEIASELGPDAPDALARLMAQEKLAGTAIDPVQRLIALLPPQVPVADGIAARLKMSNRVRKRIAAARGSGDGNAARGSGDSAAARGSGDSSAASIRALAFRRGVEAATDRLMLTRDDPRPGLAQLAGWTVPRLPISGGDIVARGVRAGPAVAQLLAAVEEQWLAEDFPDSVRTGAIADAVVAAFTSQ